MSCSRVMQQLVVIYACDLHVRARTHARAHTQTHARAHTLCALAGEALVPYYRQLLPVFNIFKNHKVCARACVC